MAKYLVQVNKTDSYLYTVNADDEREAREKAIDAFIYDSDPVVTNGEISATIRVEDPSDG